MKPAALITNYMRWFFLISAVILLPGIYSLIRFGLRPSIDFSGGTILEISLSADKSALFTESKVKELVLSQASVVQYALDQNVILLRLSPIDVTAKNKIEDEFKKLDPKLSEKRYETVGPLLGKELIIKTGYAIGISIFLISAYLAFRFSSLQYGVSAALATAHDALVVLGTFSLLGHFFGVEVDVLFVTAVLTILSFSVHDTIIVYDRIRERLKQRSNLSFEEVVNAAAIETLNRSLRNSLAIIFMLLTVFLFTTGSLHWFVLTLLVGTITGTYSSTCVALPLLVLWQRLGI